MREHRGNKVASAIRSRRVSTRLEIALFAVACLSVICVFYREIIFENRTFLPFGFPAEVMGPAPPWQFSGTIRANPYRLDAGGSAWQLEPWARIIGSSYRSRALPLWNPFQFFGTPLLGDAQPGALDILRLPAVLTTHAVGWDVYYLTQAALSLALTYAFVRAVGLRPEAATLAGIAYAFSGFMFIRGNMHYAEILHLLPGLLWGTELVVQGRLRSGLLILAGGVALSVFAGFPEAAVLTFLYAASYGAFRVAWLRFEAQSWTPSVQRGGLLLLAWIAGLALAAPQILPLFEYVEQSFNIHPPDRGLGLIALPLRSLAYIGVPYIAGLPTQPLAPGDLFTVDDYSGAAVVALAIFGALSLRRLGAPRQIGVFALGSALLWGGKLYGAPVIQEIGRAPMLVQTLAYIFAAPLLSFSLALLAAVSAHMLALSLIGRRIVLAAAFVFAGYLGFAVGLTWPAAMSAGQQHLLSTVGIAALAGCGALACLAVRRPWCAAAACLVVAVELLALSPRDVYSDRYDSLAQPPYVTWLQHQQQLPGQPFRVFSDDGILYPDYAGAFGIDDARDIDALYPRRMWEFVHTFLSPSVSDRYVGGWGHPELPTQLFSNKWLDFTNVRFILRPAGDSPADESIAQFIVQANYPPTDAQHVAELTIDGQRREVLVQRTPGDVTYRLRPTAAQPGLTFFVGFDPNGAATSTAEFIASIDDDVRFDQTLDGRTDSGRHWVPGHIDLTPYIGREVNLRLQTRSADATSAPAWGDLRLQPSPDPSQFKQVYSGEVSIWENTQAAPRAFLVSNVEHADSSAQAIADMQASDFDPLTQAVVEGAVSLSPGGGSPGATVITSYSPQEVQLTASTQSQALLVLTDTYYPGWTATVDGGTAPILPTDLAFRGVVVPPGTHHVTFHYAPASFQLGVAVAVAGVGLLTLTLWWIPRLAPEERKRMRA
jgi:hypothetical protein